MPHAIVAVDIALILLLAVHLYRGGAIVNNAIDIWFDRSDPTVQTLNQERRLFGSDTWMLATVWMRPDRVGDAGDVVAHADRRARAHPGVSRVISPTSLEVLQRDEQGLFFDRLDRRTEWSELRETLLRHPFAGKFLVHSETPDVVLVADQGAHRTFDARNRPPAAGVRGEARARHPSGGRRVGVGRHGRHQRRSQPAVVARLPLLIPLTVVVASLVLAGDAAVPVAHDARDPDAGRSRRRRRSSPRCCCPGGRSRWSPWRCPACALPSGIASSLHVTSWIASWLREGRGTATEATRAAARQLARPIIVSHVTTALGFGLLAVVQVTPVQEMALFGAAGELLSGLHVAVRAAEVPALARRGRRTGQQPHALCR